MTSPTLIQDLNLSQSWFEVLKRLIDISGNELSPLVLTITDFDEIESIRKALDNNLITHNKQLIQTVSETIFPDSLYTQVCQNRHSSIDNQSLINLSTTTKLFYLNRFSRFIRESISFI